MGKTCSTFWRTRPCCPSYLKATLLMVTTYRSRSIHFPPVPFPSRRTSRPSERGVGSGAPPPVGTVQGGAEAAAAAAAAAADEDAVQIEAGDYWQSKGGLRLGSPPIFPPAQRMTGDDSAAVKQLQYNAVPGSSSGMPDKLMYLARVALQQAFPSGTLENRSPSPAARHQAARQQADRAAQQAVVNLSSSGLTMSPSGMTTSPSSRLPASSSRPTVPPSWPPRKSSMLILSSSGLPPTPSVPPPSSSRPTVLSSRPPQKPSMLTLSSSGLPPSPGGLPPSSSGMTASPSKVPPLPSKLPLSPLEMAERAAWATTASSWLSRP